MRLCSKGYQSGTLRQGISRSTVPTKGNRLDDSLKKIQMICLKTMYKRWIGVGCPIKLESTL